MNLNIIDYGKMAAKKDTKKIKLTFMNAVGNRLVIVDEYFQTLIEEKAKNDFVREVSKSCGFDPDSILFLSRPGTGKEDIMMRIFDRDGTEETMCGNGLRCIARYAFLNNYIGKKACIRTLDGIKTVQLLNGNIWTNLGIINQFCSINPELHFAYSGLPHLVLFTENLEEIDAEKVAKSYRYNKELTSKLGYPNNMHVNLIEIIDRHTIKIKTYEACVERITQSCGTGAVASAFVVGKLDKCDFPLKIINPGGILIADKEGENIMLTGGLQKSSEKLNMMSQNHS